MGKGLAIVVALAFTGPSSLLGSQIVQTQSLGNTNLEITGSVGTFFFNDFLNYGIANAILTGVTLELKVGETLVDLDVTNKATQTQNFDFASFSNVFVGGTAPDANLVKNGIATNAPSTEFGTFTLFDSGTLTYTPGEQKIFVPQSLSYTDDSGMITALSVNPYDLNGIFTLGFTTRTFSGAMGSGGNFSFDQTTYGDATATVIYNYTVPANTPEPATVVLIASALVGFGVIAHKGLRKF